MTILKIFNKLKSIPAYFQSGKDRSGVREPGIKPSGSELSDLAEDLAGIPPEFETDFLDLGRTLQTVYKDAMALNELTQDTVREVGGKSDESILNRVGFFARKSLENFQTCLDEVSGNLEKVGGIAEYLNNLYGMCSDIEKNAMFLKVVGLNMGVESTRSLESEDMFNVIAQEIRTLSNRIMAISANIKRDSDIARKSQISAHEKIKNEFGRLNDLAEEAETAVEEAVKEINYLTESSIDALESAAKHSQRISDLTGNIVVGIQLHDSMRQRINAIAELINSSNGRGSKKELAGIVHNQKDSLDEIIEEIDTVFQDNSRSFYLIGEEVENIVASLSRFRSVDESETEQSLEKAPEPFETLKSALQHLYKLLNEGGYLVERSRTAAFRAFETASRLSTHVDDVRSINSETHMKALNAIVKAAHLGDEGRTLEVLAQEMKRISSQSNVFVGSVEEIIHSISDSVEQLQEKTMMESETDDDSDFNQLLAKGIENINEAYTRFFQDSSKIFNQAKSLGAQIDEGKDKLDLFSRLSGKLSEISVHLNRIIERGNLQSLSENASEMQHLKTPEKPFLSQPEQQAGIQPVDKKSVAELADTGESRDKKDEDEDDFGDNVELF